MDEGRFHRAIAGIDAANADDPHQITIRGRVWQKEFAHAEFVTEWVRRLRPDASEPLLTMLIAASSPVDRCPLRSPCAIVHLMKTERDSRLKCFTEETDRWEAQFLQTM